MRFFIIKKGECNIDVLFFKSFDYDLAITISLRISLNFHFFIVLSHLFFNRKIFRIIHFFKDQKRSIIKHFVRVNINYEGYTFLISIESSFFDLYDVCSFKIVTNFIQKLIKYKCLIHIINIVETITTFIV